MTYKLPYNNFHSKLKTLWDSCADQFPPKIIQDCMVYVNSKTAAIIVDTCKGEYLEVETENEEAKNIIESEDYMVTYGRWFDDTSFSYIILPLDNHMKKLNLVTEYIPRMNIKSMLPRLGLYGLDYAIRDIAHNTEYPSKLYLYKPHCKNGTPSDVEAATEIDAGKRIGFVISIDDDDIEVLIDSKYYNKINNPAFTHSSYPMIRFILDTDPIGVGKKRINAIHRIEVVTRDDAWLSSYAKNIIYTPLKNILPKELKKFEG